MTEFNRAEHDAVPASYQRAIVNGDAEEYFGTGDDGPVSGIGHCVSYPGRERRAWMPTHRRIGEARDPPRM